MPIDDPGPTGREATAARFRALLAEARRHHAIDPRLSTGEQLVLAALLAEPGSDAEAEAAEALAPTLFGMAGAAADAAAGYPRTWQWLAELRRA